MNSYNTTRKSVFPLLLAAFACLLVVFTLSGCQQTAPEESTSEENASMAGKPLANPTPPAEYSKAVWKVDYVNEEITDNFVHDNWRTSKDEFPEDKVARLGELGLNTEVSRAGMDTLQTIGGADFTSNQFDWILEQVEGMGVTPDKLTVLDLRGESHGLINGDVFMYWISNNYVNESTPTEEVTKIEEDLLDGLKKEETLEFFQTVDWGAATDLPKLKYENPTIMTEQELVESKGVKYVRFADTNHFRPDDHEVDLFVDFMAGVAEDEWLFMHCYAGEGRTTNFMVMTDIYKNYKVASFDDIAARQGLIGPVDVRTEIIETGKTHYKMKASTERRIFLQQFYNYAKDTNFKGKTWTEWCAEKDLTLQYIPPAK